MLFKIIMRCILYGINCGCVLFFIFVYILGIFKWIKVDDGYLEINKEVYFVYWGIYKFNIYLFVKYFIFVIDYKLLFRMFILLKGFFKCLLYGLNIILIFFLDIYMIVDIKVYIFNVNIFLIVFGFYEN